MTTPKLNTSAFSSYGLCSITSGAIHLYVPVSAVMCPLVSIMRATPKSAILTC